MPLPWILGAVLLLSIVVPEPKTVGLIFSGVTLVFLVLAVGRKE